MITFDATGSLGYEGEIVEYHWDFGDDTQGTGDKVTHSYSEVGEYTVTLTVTDDKNNEATDEATAFIQDSNQAPSTPTIDGPTAGTAHSHLDYTLSSEDPNGNDIYYYIDWDDGYIDEWIGPYQSGEEIIVTHLWSTRGTYNVQVKAKDAFNVESDWETLSVTMPRERFQIMKLFFRIIDKIFNDFLN
jgi:PKD repeat protein